MFGRCDLNVYSSFSYIYWGQIVLSSGSGSSFLTFTYTVSEGESSSDLAYTGTDALANNGGSSMLDGSGNPATLTLPAVGASGSLSNSQNFVIDGIKPTMTITASEGSDGFSSNDSTLSLTFTSSESTTGFAAADISVSNGAISSFSGSGTTYTATFTPNVDSTTDGVISVVSNKFSDANNTLTLSIDTVIPTITGPSGGAGSSTSSKSINENSTTVHTFSADETVTWSLNGGADASKFNINSSTGELTFKSAPNLLSSGICIKRFSKIFSIIFDFFPTFNIAATICACRSVG